MKSRPHLKAVTIEYTFPATVRAQKTYYVLEGASYADTIRYCSTDFIDLNDITEYVVDDKDNITGRIVETDLPSCTPHINDEFYFK